MERNVVSLGMARELKTAGFPQNTHEATVSVHSWAVAKHPEARPFLTKSDTQTQYSTSCVFYAAPTAQEIADQLPREFELNSDCDGTYWARYEGQQGTPMHPTLAEALAALYLKLNKETT